MRVLLLEDDLILCDTIEQALGVEGYSVDSCHDGETAMLYALNTDSDYERRQMDDTKVRGQSGYLIDFPLRSLRTGMYERKALSELRPESNQFSKAIHGSGTLIPNLERFHG